MDLTEKLLIAMPGMTDPRFDHSVIFICTHSAADGAMGLVINHPAAKLNFANLLKQTHAKAPMPVEPLPKMPVHVGGPVEHGRGFVLHSPDYDLGKHTLKVGDRFRMTATLDILTDIARSSGPKNAILALGYSGWSAGQLESEILQNGWLTTEAHPKLVFDTPDALKWETTLASMGVDPMGLSASAGRA